MTEKSKSSEWQYVKYLCPDCGHEGECRTRIGEFAFCGNCGSDFLAPPRPNKPEKEN